jgi:dUTP pyrophosphatase
VFLIESKSPLLKIRPLITQRKTKTKNIAPKKKKSRSNAPFINGERPPESWLVKTVDLKQEDKMKLKVKLLRPEARLPKRNHSDDAGLDLYSAEEILIPAGSGAKIRTGVAIKLPKRSFGQILDRSSMGAKGLKVHGGVIDCSYTGEILVVLWNHSKEDYLVSVEDKIAQLVVFPILFPEPELVLDLEPSVRGDNGFGSSGK